MKLRLSIPVLLALLMGNTYCATNEVELNEVVTSGEAEDDPLQKKVGEIKKTTKQLDKEQINDTRDLVRHETGVTVVETGRMGSSGYAIRGVDENRVDISIDGLRQAETINSQGFKEIFEGYGNFNNTRNGVEVENIKAVNITKGSDSTKSGSGALGGSVMFETKDARDFLIDKDYFLGYKNSYSTVNSERLKSYTLAGRFKWFDLLVIKTNRKGSETKNYGYESYDDREIRKIRDKADPYRIKKDSDLLKFGVSFNETNRLSVAYDNSRSVQMGTDLSYALTPPDLQNLTAGNWGDSNRQNDMRHTDDRSTRRNLAFSYENYDDTPIWDSLKITYSKQHINLKAKTDEYCEGNNCTDTKNQSGMHLDENGKMVDENNKELKQAIKSSTVFSNSATEYTDWSPSRIDFSMSTDDKNKIPDRALLEIKNENGIKKAYHVDTGQEFTDINFNGKAYVNGIKFISKMNNQIWGFNKNMLDNETRIRPYNEQSLERDLKINFPNGDYSPELKKAAEEYIGYPIVHTIFQKENKNILTDNSGKELSNIGTFLEKDIYIDCSKYDCSKPLTLMSMTQDYAFKNTYEYKTYNLKNENGYSKLSDQGGNRRFIVLPNNKGYRENMWKDRDLNTDTKQINFDLTKEFKTKSIEHELRYGSLYSASKKSMVNKQGYSGINRQWWVDVFVGTTQDGKPSSCKPVGGNDFTTTCSHTDGQFSFLIPVKTNTQAFYLGDSAKINDYLTLDVNYRHDKVKHNPQYIQGITPKIPDDMVAGIFVPLPENFFKMSAEEQKKEKEKNAVKNIKYLSNPKEFKANSYSFSTTLDPLDYLRLQAKYSTGFRAPTSDELYFTFKHPSISVVPNVDLKSERSKTKEFAITLHNSPSFITLNLFKTNYKDFIDFAYHSSISQKVSDTESRTFIRYRNMNRTKAEVNGVEISSHLELGQIWQPLKGFNLGYKLTTQKGRMDIGNGKLDTPMNAIQPQTSVYQAGYQSPNDKFGIDFYVTKVKEKAPQDTYNMFWEDEKKDLETKYPDKKLRPYNITNSYLRWLSNTYTVMDLVTYWKPIKHLTLRAGVYNLQNSRYMTWDSARSIRSFGTANLIDQETGKGLNRFLAPGRNYKFTFEFTF
jgi:hemoglobin and hemoglobin-haptoglobin-binding protein B